MDACLQRDGTEMNRAAHVRSLVSGYPAIHFVRRIQVHAVLMQQWMFRCFGNIYFCLRGKLGDCERIRQVHYRLGLGKLRSERSFSAASSEILEMKCPKM